jgi:hypothetical protein
MVEKSPLVTEEPHAGQQPTNETPAAQNEHIERAARRRFTKAGLLTPLVVTLASRPAFAMSSGQLSGTLSNAPNNKPLWP